MRIHKSGKIKYSIDDRVEKASRAVNMIQGALSTCGNVNVEVAISLFNKQIMPVLTYGSNIWGMPGNFTRFYVDGVPENLNTINDVKKYVNNSSIVNFKRVGKKTLTPRRMIITADSYETKINLLNIRYNIRKNFQQVCFIKNLSKFKAKFSNMY